MELSSEDVLRLNVLLANDPVAIRIDESNMTVHGLSGDGEATVRLNPNCRDDRYLRTVRELLSGHVMDSPGGYPVYLKRWTRMGQARDENLAQLLLLGEPEAVVAVVGAEGLTDELARRAWWANPDAESARRMLERECVVCGGMGRVLAEYLVEYLPFEDDSIAMMNSVRLVLQPGLIEDSTRDGLWQKGKKKNAYLVGFLQALPDELPEPLEARPDFNRAEKALAGLCNSGNPCARQLVRVLSGAGQTFISTCEAVLRKPANQDVVNELLDAIARYFADFRLEGNPDATLDEIIGDARDVCCGEGSLERPAGLPEAAKLLPEYEAEFRAMCVLARLGYPVVRPVFSQSTAIGSLMRRKLQPITDQIQNQLSILKGAGDG